MRRHCSIRDRIHSLVEPMPLAAVHELFRQIKPDGQFGGEGMASVQAAFIEHLNKFRPQRARRLFSNLFVPLWIDDPVLLRAPRPVPGMIQRVDVAALWRQLSAGPLAEIARTAQALFDHLADNMLVNDAVRTPDALRLMDLMRQTTVRTLDAVLAGAAGSRNFVEGLNRFRLQEVKAVLGEAEPKLVGLDRPYVQFMRDYLVTQAVCAQSLASSALRSTIEAPSEEQAEQESIALTDAEAALRGQLSNTMATSTVRWLLPLVQLHARRRYSALGFYVREAGQAGGGPLPEALLAHFESCCLTLTNALEAALKIDQREPNASIKISNRERSTIEAMMARLGQMIPSLFTAGLLESRHTGPLFQAPWLETSTFFVNRVAKITAGRFSPALMARRQPTLDHRDLLWLTKLVWSWYHMGRRYDFGGLAAFPKWQAGIMDDIGVALPRALKFEAGESLSERFNHVMRINEYAAAVDQKITPLLAVSSTNVVQMIADSIAHDTESLDPVKSTLIREYLDMVRKELNKSKRWQSLELANLIKQAEACGL